MTESGFETKSLSLHSLGIYNHDAKLIIIIKPSLLAPRIGGEANEGERNLNKIFLYHVLNTTTRK